MSRADETSLAKILAEVYNPKYLAIKVLPVAWLRVEKALALVINGGVGRACCGWKRHESRLYDHIGEQTATLCRVLYQTEITEELVRAFLRRRFLFCAITATATTLQIIFQLLGLQGVNFLITAVLLPLTVADRGFSMLVTKMTPRYERGLSVRATASLFDALEPVYPEIEKPPRYKMYKLPIFNLTHLEIMIASTQALSGMLILFYTFVVLEDAAMTEDHLPRYFDTGDGRCEMGSLCFAPGTAIIALRILKEITNFISPCIEWGLTPLKYGNNSGHVKDNINAILTHSGGADAVAAKIAANAEVKAAVAECVERFIIDARSTGGGCCDTSKPMEDGDDEDTLYVQGYISRFPLTADELGMVKVMCDCVERERPPGSASVFDELFGGKAPEPGDTAGAGRGKEVMAENPVAASEAEAYGED
jgi:hypothetical protein